MFDNDNKRDDYCMFDEIITVTITTADYITFNTNTNTSNTNFYVNDNMLITKF